MSIDEKVVVSESSEVATLTDALVRAMMAGEERDLFKLDDSKRDSVLGRCDAQGRFTSEFSDGTSTVTNIVYKGESTGNHYEIPFQAYHEAGRPQQVTIDTRIHPYQRK